VFESLYYNTLTDKWGAPKSYTKRKEQWKESNVKVYKHLLEENLF